MLEVKLQDLTELCSTFKVAFSLSIHPTLEQLVIYNFGPKVSWTIDPMRQLTWEEYVRIAMRLAATYPEKILNPYDSK